MEISAIILVSKDIASGLKSNPEDVAECLREAEATMNTQALERKRIVSGTPRLHSVQASSFGKEIVELTFRAPTRAI